MNYKGILIGFSAIMIVIALFMAFPLAIALLYREQEMIVPFLIPITAALILFGAVLFFVRILSRGERIRDFSPREGFILVALSWIGSSFLGAAPLYLSGSFPTLADAYFEIMSGFTTTGASVMIDIESGSRSILFWRSLTHWLGGMGIIVLTVALFPILGIGGYLLMKAETPGPDVDRITARISSTAKILWFIYCGMTILQTLILLLCGMDLFDALTHTFGTLATGGFSPMQASVGAYNSAAVHWVITLFMMLAGTNFILHFHLIFGRFERLRINSEFKAYWLIFAVATAAISVILVSKGVHSNFLVSLRHAAFQVASVLTTTGFATEDFAAWPQGAGAILFLLMFIGGCSGSTGGGMKVVRVLVLFKKATIELKYLLHPRSIFRPRLNRNTISNLAVAPIVGFAVLYLFLLLLTTFIVSLFEYDLTTAMTTALATLGNIGPGFGLVGPAENFAHFPAFLKWFLSFVMMVGRLELYTILVLFMPIFWKKF